MLATPRARGRGYGASELLFVRANREPPLSGDILLELKSPRANGTTHVKFTGTELIERLVALVSALRINLVRHHGFFAPNARLRPCVVALARADSGVDTTKCGHKKTGRYLQWPELMVRVFEIDVTAGPKCNTKGMQTIASITEREVIRAILMCVGQPTVVALEVALKLR